MKQSVGDKKKLEDERKKKEALAEMERRRKRDAELEEATGSTGYGGSDPDNYAGGY